MRSATDAEPDQQFRRYNGCQQLKRRMSADLTQANSVGQASYTRPSNHAI